MFLTMSTNMRSLRRFPVQIFWSFAVLFLVAFVAMAKDTNGARSPQALAKQLVSAMRSGSTEELSRLFHPDCPRNDPRFAVFERAVKKDLKEPVIEVKAVPQQALENSIWIVEPTHMIGIHGYEDPEQNEGFYSRADAVAQTSENWYLVTCRVPKTKRAHPR